MGPNGERTCIFLDVDGTLIDIAERPDAVRVPSELRRTLALAAEACGGAVALVSGRTIDNIDGLFAPLRLCASGVHGAEMRLDPEGPVERHEDAVLPPGLAAAVEVLAAAVPGTIVENKRFSVALHYRLAPASGRRLRAGLEALIQEAGDPQLKILPGHMVLELKRATFDKGMAVRAFMANAPFLGRRPIYVGDDVTDQPAFEAALGLGGLAYSVGHLFEGVSGSFPDPKAVRRWLANLAVPERG